MFLAGIQRLQEQDMMRSANKSIWVACIVMLLGAAWMASGAEKAAAPGDDVKFVPLFDGKTLDGWFQRGGKAKYAAENGVLVGSSVPNTSNSFLCTKKTYGDFVLEYEFKVDPSLNSGVQIRSNSLKEYRNFRVHGYQVEIDPSKRAWTAGIYEEGRRGWLNNLVGNDPARKAFKQNEWNKVRVEAVGDSIKTWLNGVPAADLVDSMTLTGFIGLQVHGVGKRTEPLQVRWRNLRIKDLGLRKWVPLFDGKTLDGWTPLPGGKWEVKDGVILGTCAKSERRHGILLSDKKFKDFTIRFKFRAIKGNSGFYFRVDKVKSGVNVNGFQAEVAAGDMAVGGLYETGGRAWVTRPDPKTIKKLVKQGEWNQMTVSAHAKRIVVHVNNRKTAELKNDPGRTEGYLGLQLHGGQDMHVEYKDIEILSESAKLPATVNGK